jgi:hypothetical protein
MTSFSGPGATPEEYISQIKSRYPPKELPISDSSPVLNELFDGNEGQYKQMLESAKSQDYAQLLLDRLAPDLPEGFAALIQEGILSVGEINDPTPNARVERLEGPTYAILFNTGLQQFIYRVTRALSTRFHPQGHQDAIEDVPFDETCRIITDIFFWFRETGQAFGLGYPVTTDQVMIASMLATEAETFFLAHELGHVFSELQAIAYGASEDDRVQAWDDEAAADRFAMTALMNSASRKHTSVHAEVCYAGAEIALLIFAGLEALDVPFEASHPSATSRLENLRAYLRHCVEDAHILDRITSLSQPIDLLFTNILYRLRSPDWEGFLDRAAEDVVKELDRLLDQCTGGMVPDYYSFQNAVNSLLDRLSSHRLYERVAQAAADFFSHMTRLSKQDDDPATKSEARVAFQKYKLFVSIIRDMHEPAKSFLEKALGIET